jgi:nicotinate-nucleotide pyrophosphorylase (carboxylating)
MWFEHPHLRQLIELALAEDIGTGDHATHACLDPQREGTAHVRAKSELVVCGTALFTQVMQRVDPRLRVDCHLADGQRAAVGQQVLSVHGPLAAILTAERTALNFMQRMSGIATQTAAFVQAVAGTSARIVDTRKTLPGFRSLDKYAVRCGGGHNHRTALDAGILIKENHTHAAGSIAQAVAAARQVGSHFLKVEVEVETLADLDAALAAGAEIILLDNMDIPTLRQAVQQTAGRAMLEASGNMSLDRVRQVAETGVDLISVGALTHSVVAADLSLRIV